MAYSAPPAIAVRSAMNPASRPITSTKNSRSCEEAVSRSRSMASIAVLHAVSKPIVRSVPARSLSMVLAMPITGRPHS